MRQTTAGIVATLALFAWTPLGAQAPARTGDSTTADSTRTVPIGYGSARAANLTGAVVQVTAPQFNPGRISNPQQLIQGKVAGVDVVDNDDPGGQLSVRIRGALGNGAGDPLYVIDGMPIGPGTGSGLSFGRDPLNFLNPGDIASITVLKGGEASAIYGARAANGVVIITTTPAEPAAGTALEYRTSASTASAARLPAVLSPAQFRGAVAQYAPSSVGMLGTASTDWLGLMSRTAYGQSQDLALTSAQRGTYLRLSLGYGTQDGVVRGSSTERLSLGMALDQRLFGDHLDVRANLKGARTDDHFTPNGALADAVAMAPTQPVYDPANAQGFGTGYWDWNTAGPSATNPIAALNLASDRATSWRSLDNLQLEVRIPGLEALRATVNLGYDVTSADHTRFAPSTLADQVRGQQGYLDSATPNQSATLAEGYVSYAAPLGILPGSIDVTGGYSYARAHTDAPELVASGLSTNLLGNSGIPSAGLETNSLAVSTGSMKSLFARAGYDLAGRYLATASLRRDRWVEGPGGWQTYPSVALAWRVSREPFARALPALSDLKLRASWARTGDVTSVMQMAAAGSGLGAIFSVDPFVELPRNDSYGLGLDFALLAGRVAGSVDWYSATTSHLVATVPVPGGPTFSNYLLTNIGTARNRGIELALSAQILRGSAGAPTWTASFTAAHNSNQLLDLGSGRVVASILTGDISGGVGESIQVLEPGVAMHSFYACRQAYQSGKPVEGQYYNLAGDSIVTGCTSANRRPYHGPAPSWTVGHTSSLTWGRLDFSLTLRAYLGSWVYDNVASQGAYDALTNAAAPSNTSASVLRTGFVTPQLLSDYFVQDASFLRMDNVTLGWSFPLGGRQVRAYVTVQNAFTVTGYRGVNPSAASNGIDDNLVPYPRILTAGLDVKL